MMKSKTGVNPQSLPRQFSLECDEKLGSSLAFHIASLKGDEYLAAVKIQAWAPGASFWGQNTGYYAAFSGASENRELPWSAVYDLSTLQSP